MRRRITIASTLFAVCVALVYQVGCGKSNATPTAPSGGGGGGSAAVIITIVGMNGNQSFTPNPATVPAGQTVAWKNADSTTHHIVQDGGGFDAGNVAPGATSIAVTAPAGSVSYHCSIHPSMVGGFNGSSGNGPGSPGYGGYMGGH
jgi:plastocyanin